MVNRPYQQLIYILIAHQLYYFLIRHNGNIGNLKETIDCINRTAMSFLFYSKIRQRKYIKMIYRLIVIYRIFNKGYGR